MKQNRKLARRILLDKVRLAEFIVTSVLTPHLYSSMRFTILVYPSKGCRKPSR